MIEFLEYSSLSQYVFDYKVVDKWQTTYAVFVEKLYCTCKQPDVGERIKECDGCNNWFYLHCENLEIPPNSPYNSSNWFGTACQRLPAIHINSLPYIVLEKIFFKACHADERMFAVIALVCKKWSLFINEKFVERVHYAWLDREYDAQSWSKEVTEKFQKPLIIETCFHCNRHYKVEIWYYRTPTGCSIMQPDLNAGSIYCYFCALRFDNRCDWEWKCSCFFCFLIQ